MFILLATLFTINCICHRQRGIGLCGILALCPGRMLNEAIGLITVDANAVEVTPSFEMRKWRPWRLDQHDRPDLYG